MDKLVTTRRERFWHPDVLARDQWVAARAAELPKGSRVLDAGAGSSKYRPFFAHCHYRTQDFCQYQGERVKYLEPIDFVCDITQIPLPDQSLEAILCTEVLEHVVDPMRVVEEFARLLGPGGRLFITAPLLSHLHMEPYHYYGGFTHYWYRHWLPLKGFKIDSVQPIGGPGFASSTFNLAFYNCWASAEHGLAFPKKLISRLFRAAAKVGFHYVGPWLLPKFDPWFGSELICGGYAVAARRVLPSPE